MHVPTTKQAKPYLEVIIALALIGLIALCILLAREYRTVRQLNYFNSRTSLLMALHAHRPATAADIASVQAWMTFDYINHLFSLPPNYLQTTFSITDSRYPRMTINGYAADANIASPSALTQVQQALTSYLADK